MSAPSADLAREAGVVQKMTLPTLTAMVVGGLVGAGVFSLPARFGVATAVTPTEVGLFAIILAAGVIGVVGLWTGRVTL